jgi:hypothetical protein
VGEGAPDAGRERGGDHTWTERAFEGGGSDQDDGRHTPSWERRATGTSPAAPKSWQNATYRASCNDSHGR